MAATIPINRAPVLTVWAAVVAQRLGFDEDEDLKNPASNPAHYPSLRCLRQGAPTFLEPLAS